MTVTRITLSFRHPFILTALDREQPPGIYNVDIDEQLIDGLTFVAMRRVGATFYSPAGTDHSSCRYAVPMSMPELNAIVAQGSV